MTRTERRRRQQRRRRAVTQRAACLALALLAVAAAFAWSGRPQEPETPEATVPVTVTALPAETPTLEPITLEFEDQEAIDPMEASKVALAKMVWGEARGCSTTEQAATIWCVLNRYDSGDRFWADTVEGITTQPCQFYGYDPSNPVDPDILALVDAVLTAVVLEHGERAMDPDAPETALGWRLAVPFFSVKEMREKYEIHARRGEDGKYILGVMERRSDL